MKRSQLQNQHQSACGHIRVKRRKTGTSIKSTGYSSKEFDAYKQICVSLLMNKHLQSSNSVFSQQTRSGIFVYLATQSATDAHY